MKLFIAIILMYLSLSVVAQDDKHLKGKAINVNYGLYETDSANINIYMDGLILSDKHKKEIGNRCVKCKVNLQGDSIAYVKSGFLYLINGELFEMRQRQAKLESLNPEEITSFVVYSKKEADKVLGIKAKYGLIKIEE
jgi:hypothetical protein